jgi:predicted nucleotidyltransferase
MRLSAAEVKIIVDTVRDALGSGASVRLFGSRLDDRMRGGDIDLAVEADRVVERREESRALLAARLQRRLNGRAVDVLLIDPMTARTGIRARALSEGIRLEP